MFREIQHVPQHAEGRRRWFRHADPSDGMDLIVWYDERAAIRGFQLCYERAGIEHALTWHAGERVVHQRVDAGEGSPAHDRTPVLVAPALPPPTHVIDKFVGHAGKLDHEIVAVVTRELRAGGVTS